MKPASPGPSIRQRAGSVAAGGSAADLIALVDALIAAYVSWREECSSVALSYAAWQASERWDKSVAFSAYVAALDREEAAAETCRCLVERIARVEASLSADVPRPRQAEGSSSAGSVRWSPRSIAQRLRR
jgi:hypothetical protein